MRRLLVTRLRLGRLEARLAPAVVTVDATANVHTIDPNIYGSAFATTAQLADLRLPINRNGGNASDTYSFAQDATNHGSDWFFESIASGSGNGQGTDAWIAVTKPGGAQPSLTLNLFDWAASPPTATSLAASRFRSMGRSNRPTRGGPISATAFAQTAPTSPVTTRMTRTPRTA